MKYSISGISYIGFLKKRLFQMLLSYRELCFHLFIYKGAQNAAIKSTLLCCLNICLVLLLIATNGWGQGYIDCATIIADDDFYDLGNLWNSPVKIIDGYTYVATHTIGYRTQQLPVINGESYHNTTGNNNIDSYIAVFDPACNQLLGTYVGGSDNTDVIIDINVDANGDIIVAGWTSSTDFPTTDGSSIVGTYAFFVQKYALNGNLLFSSILPTDEFGTVGLIVDGTDYYILSDNESNTFPTTDGSTLGSNSNGFVAKYDGNNNLVYLTQTGALGNSGDHFDGVVVNGCLYVLGATDDPFPTTDGTTVSNVGSYDAVLMKYDATGNVVFSTVFGGNNLDLRFNYDIVTDGNAIYIASTTFSSDFLTTDGSVFTGLRGVYLRKYDLNGNLIFSKLYSDGNTSFDLQVVDNAIYLIMEANEGLPVVNGAANAGGNNPYLVKMDTDGNIIYSTYYGGPNTGQPSDFYVNSSGEVYFLVWTENALTTDGTSGQGTAIVKLNPDGSLCAASHLNDNPFSALTEEFNVIGDTVYIVNLVAEYFNADNYSTDGSALFPTDGYDVQLTKFVFCPPAPTITTDDLTPSTQTVCENGLVEQIIGMEQVIDGSTFPTLYQQGTQLNQPNIELKYQWQVSNTSGGPWTDIPGAVAQQQSYSPPPTTINQYYQRLTKTAECCGGTLISTSTESAVIVGANAAPTVDAGGTFYSCPGSSVALDATVTGGGGGYMYDWNDGAFTMEDPSVSPTESTVYTLIVTDANTCQQADQATVVVYTANAGDDASVCEGVGTTIGGSALQGVTIVPSGGTPPASQNSIEYDWSPKDGTLSCTDCPNPIATPATATQYTLNVTINRADGTSCMTTDMVTVAVLSAPTSAMTITDTVICLGDEIELGTNLAPLGTPTINSVSQSSISTYTATVANLTDGILNAYAGRTNDGLGENILVDLGSVQTINKIDLAARSTDYHFNIEVSTDNITYTDLGLEIGYNSGTRLSSSELTTFSFIPQDVRYIRMSSLDASRDVEISEFVVSYDYAYAWTPGLYISTNGQSATFDAGNLEMPTNNPITYTISANIGTCNFYEQVTVAVIEARADEDYCGPRKVGEPDRTPNIAETYSWVKITDPGITTGTGDFTGVTNEAIVPVSASVGGNVGYELTVSYTLNGSMGICRDTVIVPPTCGTGCDVVSMDGSCPSFDNGQPTLVAYPPNEDRTLWTYSWTSDLGMVGLDSYTNDTVTLTDNVSRRYYITFTSTIDPSFTCIDSIDANSASYAVPAFSATSPVTVCPGIPINIGDMASVAGLTYQWSNAGLLDDAAISYPEATLTNNTEFTVTVTDDVTGCRLLDTVQVEVFQVADAGGPDLLVCDNGVVELGNNQDLTAQGYTYSWTPVLAAGDYRNGTNQNSPQPEIFIAATQTFTLTVTAPGGTCSTMDNVNVMVEPLPPSFTLPDLDFCPSSPPVTLGVNSGGVNQVPTGYNYNWTPATVSDATAINPTVNTPLPTSSVTYEVVVSNTNGCNQKATQTINPTITPPMVANSQTICLGESILIGDAANPTGGGESYSWNPMTDLNLTNPENPEFTPSATGTTTFAVTKTVGGCSSTAEVTITVIEAIVPTLIPQTICEGETIQIGVTNSPLLSYEWSPATGLDNAFISNPTFTGTVSTNYTLTVINANGCLAQAGTSVTVNPVPAVTITLPDTTICNPTASNTVINASVNPAGAYAYSWSPTTYLDNANALTPTFYIPSPGNYEYILEVIDQTTGCSLFDTTTMNVAYDIPMIIASSFNNPTVCNGTDGSIILTLTNVPDGSYTINYMDAVPSAQTFTNVVVTNGSATITGLSAGTYNDLTITISGCTSTENIDITLSDPGIPTLAATSNNPTTCGGSDGSIILTLTNVLDGTYTINYMDGVPSAQTFTNVSVTSGSATILGLSAGMYNDLTITVSGCISTANVDLTLSDPTSPTALISPITICASEMGMVEALPLNGSGTYSTHAWTDLGTGTATGYTLSTTNTSVLTVDAMGTGTINLQYTLTDDASCSTTLNHTLTLVEPDSVTLCAEPTNSATFTAQVGLTNVVWFNAADVQVGTGNMLTVDANTDGLADGTETFYYAADEGTGCSIGLCCPIVVTLENCAYDFGDLPDVSASTNTDDYQTTLANNGPRHKVISGLTLGSTIDDELDGQPSNDALGDDADEDGLLIFSSLSLYPGLTFRLPFSYVNSTGNTAHVEAWIDWNADGAFDGVGEMVADWNDGSGALPDRLEVTIPSDVSIGNLLGLRIRISHQDNMTPYGLINSGEVEDYLIGINCPQVCVPIQVTISKDD